MATCELSPLRIAAAGVAGYAASVASYRATHTPRYPEIARYTIGGLLIAGAAWLISGRRAGAAAFVAASSVGVGVAAARLQMEMEAR